MHLGVMLCLVLLASRCKYFKVFTGARKVTAWNLAGSCSPPAKTSLMPKSPSVSEWDDEGPGEDHMCERWPVRLHYSSSEARPRFHISLLLSRCVVEEDPFKDVAKTRGMFGSAL